MIRLINITLLLITITLLVEPHGGLNAATNDPQPVRIGVYIRSGFETCLENWVSTETHLTRTIPGYDFMIVPLASRDDIYTQLEKGNLDFFATNSAIYVCTEERFNTSALCSMVDNSDPSQRNYTGSIIRKSSRDDLAHIKDIEAARFAAVKPWSFAGWIMQRQTLKQHRINPLKDLYVIEFNGTHQEVIQSVLDGTVDVGAVATDLLKQQIESGQINPRSLFVFDKKGDAVPLKLKHLASTEAYPNWVFAKTAKTDDRLAGKVLQALLSPSNDPQANRKLYPFMWTVPENYQSVRNCLSDLMGAKYAYATAAIPEPKMTLPGWGNVMIMAAIFAIAVILFVAWRRTRRRENMVREELQINHNELNEVRAGKNLIETILTRVECGIDIVDENDEIIYVAPGIENRYGPWQGKKCYEYYLNEEKPCSACRKKAACKMQKNGDPYVESKCGITLQDDHHPLSTFLDKDKPSKLLQVPFYDENGRWLYARVHLPPENLSLKTDIDEMVAQFP